MIYKLNIFFILHSLVFPLFLFSPQTQRQWWKNGWKSCASWRSNGKYCDENKSPHKACHRFSIKLIFVNWPRFARCMGSSRQGLMSVWGRSRHCLLIAFVVRSTYALNCVLLSRRNSLCLHFKLEYTALRAMMKKTSIEPFPFRLHEVRDGFTLEVNVRNMFDYTNTKQLIWIERRRRIFLALFLIQVMRKYI